MALGDTEFRKLGYAHIRSLRQILGIKAARYSHVSNAEILKKAGAPTFYSMIRQKQLALFGHILRLDDSHPDVRATFANKATLSPFAPFGTNPKRRQGRPRLTWSSEIIKLIKAAFPNITSTQIVERAQDRALWRGWVWSLSPTGCKQTYA